ncbi:MAG: DUF1549 domain-containing protein, partial [Gemmataceae bacterium]|nr:DUF1549 domain-containing protein [Gemmataceae bacterium]
MITFRALPLACLLLLPTPATADPTPEGVEFFEKKIRPVLIEHCHGCHSTQAKKVRGGLLLDSRESILKGGDSGPAIVPGEPGKSRLIEAIGYTNTDLQMPPKAKLPDVVIADLTAWVKMGAPWPKDAVVKGGRKYEFDLLQRKREHWAWQPVRAQAPPPVKDVSWPRSPVDHFLLAKLEAKGLAPAPSTDRRTLIRRLSFDLTGLPPTPAEVEAFLAEAAAKPQAAWAKAVDRLLASPHFGERWARHWLDLVRYAESLGHEFD